MGVGYTLLNLGSREMSGGNQTPNLQCADEELPSECFGGEIGPPNVIFRHLAKCPAPCTSRTWDTHSTVRACNVTSACGLGSHRRISASYNEYNSSPQCRLKTLYDTCTKGVLRDGNEVLFHYLTAPLLGNRVSAT